MQILHAISAGRSCIMLVSRYFLRITYAVKSILEKDKCGYCLQVLQYYDS